MKLVARWVVAVVVVVVVGAGFVTPQSAEAGLFARHCAAKAACEPVCEPAPLCEPVYEPAPVCAPEPICAPVCAPAPVCPPPPVNVTICVKDPCTCCTYEVSVCVPAQCAREVPCLDSCRPGLLGRKVLTYKWPCGHCVEVVITKHGKTIVRG